MLTLRDQCHELINIQRIGPKRPARHLAVKDFAGNVGVVG